MQGQIPCILKEERCVYFGPDLNVIWHFQNPIVDAVLDPVLVQIECLAGARVLFVLSPELSVVFLLTWIKVAKVLISKGNILH